MKTSTLVLLLITGVLLVSIGGCVVSANNQEVYLKNQFTQKISERTTFYDKMWKTLAQKSELALKNDSSFKETVNIVMEGRKDAPGIFMKWVTESNPTATFTQVTAMYADLSRAVEAEREGFFTEEKYLQDIKMQHDNLLHTFPNTLIFACLGTKDLQYTPITSDRTDGVIKSGKDNDVKLLN